MLSEDTPVEVEDLPRRVRFSGIAFEKRGVIAVGDKANVLTVMLAGVEKALFRRDTARFVFGKASEWEKRMGKLVLRQRRQHITLVTRRLQTLPYRPAARVGRQTDSRIVSRGDVLRAQFPRKL